jgi:hypothetical protein
LPGSEGLKILFVFWGQIALHSKKLFQSLMMVATNMDRLERKQRVRGIRERDQKYNVRREKKDSCKDGHGSLIESGGRINRRGEENQQSTKN